LGLGQPQKLSDIVLRDRALNIEAKTLVSAARASSDLSPQARASFLDNELRLMDSLAPQFEVIDGVIGNIDEALDVTSVVGNDLFVGIEDVHLNL
jgi:hypothetical protein